MTYDPSDDIVELYEACLRAGASPASIACHPKTWEQIREFMEGCRQLVIDVNMSEEELHRRLTEQASFLTWNVGDRDLPIVRDADCPIGRVFIR